MKLNNLNDLFLDQLRDMYSAEKQSIGILEKLIKKAHDPKLKQRFETHLKETHGHVEKVEKAFSLLGQKSEGHHCKAMAGIIAEIEELITYEAPHNVMDAGLIAGEQRIEHYEMAGYGTIIELAEELDHKDVEKIIRQILREEEKTDKKLTDRSEDIIDR